MRHDDATRNRELRCIDGQRGLVAACVTSPGVSGQAMAFELSPMEALSAV
jgi:hypothetical protein